MTAFERLILLGTSVVTSVNLGQYQMYTARHCFYHRFHFSVFTHHALIYLFFAIFPSQLHQFLLQEQQRLIATVSYTVGQRAVITLLTSDIETSPCEMYGCSGCYLLYYRP